MCNIMILSLCSDKVANALPLLSLIITPILIFFLVVSTAASQMTLTKPPIGAFHLNSFSTIVPANFLEFASLNAINELYMILSC
jgi:hypothetical protein